MGAGGGSGQPGAPAVRPKPGPLPEGSLGPPTALDAASAPLLSGLSLLKTFFFWLVFPVSKNKYGPRGKWI